MSFKVGSEFKSPKQMSRAIEALTGGDRLDVTKLKNLDQIASGGYVSAINFAGTLSQFANAKTNQYWSAEIAGTLGGVTFGVGDRLICKSNVTGTPPNLTDTFFWAKEKNSNPIATNTLLGVVKVDGTTIAIDAAGTLSSTLSSATYKVVATPTERLALPKINNLYVVQQSDTNTLWYLNGNDTPSIAANWKNGGSASANVASVNNRTGVITLSKDDVGLGDVSNTAPADLPVSTATQLAIDSVDSAAVKKTSLGATNGVAELDGLGKLKNTQIPDSLLSGLKWQQTWDASTNIPALPAPSTANKGFFYKVSKAGTVSSVTYGVGDWVISNGTAWERVENQTNPATTSTKGEVKLAGDLAGTADSPTVTKVNGISYPDTAGSQNNFLVSDGSKFVGRKLNYADMPTDVLATRSYRRTRNNFYVKDQSDTDIIFDADWPELSNTTSDLYLTKNGANFTNNSPVSRTYLVSYNIIYPRMGSNASTTQWKAWIEPYANGGMRIASTNQWATSATANSGDPKLSGSATFCLPPNGSFKVRTWHKAGSAAESGGIQLGVELGGGNEGSQEGYSTTIQITLLK